MALVCGAVLLGSCNHEQPAIEQSDAAGSAIRFEHSDFSPELAEYAVQRDPRTAGVTYFAAFYGADSSAIIVASMAGPGYVWEERSTERVVSGLLEDAKIDWGARGRARSGIGHIPYRLFQVAGEPLSCVGFAHTVGNSPDDRNRKRNLVLGYFCRDETRPMTAQSAEELLAQIKLGRSAVPSGPRRPQASP